MLKAIIRIENSSCFPFPVTPHTLEGLPDGTKEPDIYSTEFEEGPNDPDEEPPAGGI